MNDFEKELEKLCSRDPLGLTDSEKDFMRARAGYLSDENIKKFAEVLEGVVIPEKEEEKDVRVEDPKEEEVTSDDLPLPGPEFQ